MERASVAFWERHSVNFLEMAFQQDRREILENPDGYGEQTDECGDSIRIFLMVENNRIRTASFDCEGCLYAVACANAAATLVEGRAPEEALAVSADTIVDFLGTLPRKEHHCAHMAVEALRRALDDLERRGSGKSF